MFEPVNRELIRKLARARGEQGTTLAELMVVVVILGILATATVFIITAVFNANIQAGQKLDQQTTIQTLNSFFNKHLSATKTGKVGMLNEAETGIDRLTVAGDQFTMVSGDYCYRIIYHTQAKVLGVATQEAEDGSCKRGTDGIAPKAGPSDTGSARADDPVLKSVDISTGLQNGSLDGGIKYFPLAFRVAALGSGGLRPFSFKDSDAVSVMKVDDQAKKGGGNCSSGCIYGDPGNLANIASVKLSFEVEGATQAASIKVGEELYQNDFYVGGLGQQGGEQAPGGPSGGDRLYARVATTGALPANTRSGNILTANSQQRLPNIDGKTLIAGDRILVKNEATASKNGLYEVTQVGSNFTPGTPAASGELGDYNPALYWAQMGTNFNDHSGHGNHGTLQGGGGSFPPCPPGNLGYSDIQVTGAASGNPGWGGQYVDWGDGVQRATYTSDSNDARAAIHAGVLKVGETKTLRVCTMPGLSSYSAVTRNGITTNSWGPYSSSKVYLEPGGGGGGGAAGSADTGFDFWNSPGHNAWDFVGGSYVQTNYSTLWQMGGGNATIIMGVRPDNPGSNQSLFSTDGTFSGLAGVDFKINSAGDLQYQFYRLGGVAYQDVTWSINLNGQNFNDFAGQWVGVAVVFNGDSVSDSATVYVKDLSNPSNPWKNQGTKNLGAAGALASCAGTTCATFPGRLVFGARSTGGAIDQNFDGAISQIAAYVDDLDPNNPLLLSEGQSGTPDTPGTPWKLTRVPEMDDSSKIYPSQLVTVAEGTTNEDSIWQLTSDGPLTLNSSNLQFARKDGLGQSAAESLVPVGTILATARSSAPSGYLMANGQTVSRTTYADLFAAIGTTYNTGGESSSVFRLPDLRGRVPVGADSGAGRIASNGALGNSGGSETRTLTLPNLPSHNHTFSATTNNSGAHTHWISAGVDEGWWAWQNTPTCAVGGGICAGAAWTFNGAIDNGVGTEWSGDHTHSVSGTTSNAGSGSAFNITQPYQVINYMIKY